MTPALIVLAVLICAALAFVVWKMGSTEVGGTHKPAVQKICGQYIELASPIIEFSNAKGDVGGYMVGELGGDNEFSSAVLFDAYGKKIDLGIPYETASAERAVELKTLIAKHLHLLEEEYPNRKSFFCPIKPDLMLGGGLTGTPGNFEAKPIGSLEMTADGLLVLTLSSEEPVTISEHSGDYQKWIGHVGGIKPGETKPVPPLHR